MKLNFLTLLMSAGPLLWVLLALSLYVVYVAAMRLQVLSRLGRDAATLIERARATTAEEGPAAALAELDYAARSGSGAALPAVSVLRAGLSRAERGPEAAQGAMNAAILQQDARLYAGLQALGTSAQVGPLLGLLGTVVGMVRSFLVFSQTSSPTTAQLATGISEALVNTGAGLIVAIIAYVARGALRSRADTVAIGMERVREELPGWLGRSAGSQSVGGRPASRSAQPLVAAPGEPLKDGQPVDFQFGQDGRR